MSYVNLRHLEELHCIIIEGMIEGKKQQDASETPILDKSKVTQG